MEGKENVSMTKLWLQILAQIQKHGILFVLLFCTNGLFFKLFTDTQRKVDTCLEQQIQDLKSDRKEFTEVLNEVKSVLRENNRIIRRESRD